MARTGCRPVIECSVCSQQVNDCQCSSGKRRLVKSPGPEEIARRCKSVREKGFTFGVNGREMRYPPWDLTIFIRRGRWMANPPARLMGDEFGPEDTEFSEVTKHHHMRESSRDQWDELNEQ